MEIGGRGRREEERGTDQAIQLLECFSDTEVPCSYLFRNVSEIVSWGAVEAY